MCVYKASIRSIAQQKSVLPRGINWLRSFLTSYFEQACSEITLEEVPQYAEDITNGQVTGRVVVKI